MTAIELMLLTGEWSLRVLFLILIARPVARHFKIRFLMKWRRHLGWLMGLLVLIHLAVYLFLYIDSLSFLLTVVDDLWFITGLVATIIIVALTATSNNYSLRRLKKHWKTLHKATYYVGFIGILHGEIASKQTNHELYVMLAVYSLLILWRYRNWMILLATICAVTYSGNQILDKPAIPQATIVEQEQVSDLAWERCGIYGLQYYEAPNGFWNCRRSL